jgi:lysophospholipase L1-like esterase
MGACCSISAAAAAEPEPVAALGDSIAAGWGPAGDVDATAAAPDSWVTARTASLASRLGAQASNFARPGTGADDLPEQLDRLLRRGVAYKLVIIETGTNDACTLSSVDSFRGFI